MVKMVAVAFFSSVVVFENVNVQTANVQKEGVAARLKNTSLLSKSKEQYSYSQIFKRYRIIIFARADDCSQCISEQSPWIQMIRSKDLPTCFVVIDKSFRVAKYYYEAKSLPFDFYSDTSRAASEVVAQKNTPVVLLFDEAGREIFFDSPLYEHKRFMDLLTSTHFKVMGKKNNNSRLLKN